MRPEPLLSDTGKGLTVLHRGKNLYSPLEPREAARRRAASAPLQDRSLVLVPGLGLGYGLEVLLQRLPPGSRVLCVEADPALAALASSARAELPRDGRLKVLEASSPERAAAAAGELGWHRFRRVQVVVLCGSYYLDRAGYDAMRRRLEEELRQFWQNRLTLAHMSGLWLRNLFANLVTLAEGDPPPVLEQTRPVLVAGAGPSLEAALPLIRRFRARLTVLCVDTALPVLAEAGAAPDWVYALDAQHYNLEDFLPYRDPSLCLLCDLSSNPVALRLFPRRLPFATRFHPLALFERLSAAGLLPPELPPLGSVGVTAVRAALELTAGPVLLAGLDFSYPGGATHARGAPSHRRDLAACMRLRPAGMRPFEAVAGRPQLRLKGKGGRPVLTDLVLRSYSLQLQGFASRGGRVFDLGEEGLETGAPRLDPQRLERLLAGTSPPALPLRRFHPRAGEVRRFLLREVQLLRAAEAELAKSLGQDRGLATSSAAASPAVAAVEYILLCTPEADPERLAERGNLGLGLANARRLRGSLERLAGGRLAAGQRS